jgi:hypothetical protein
MLVERWDDPPFLLTVAGGGDLERDEHRLLQKKENATEEKYVGAMRKCCEDWGDC